MTVSLAEPRNRYVLVVESTTLNGIDFVELSSVDSTTLLVHFLNKVPVAAPSIAAAIAGGDSIRGLVVKPIVAADWAVDAAGRPELTLRVDRPGDFSDYTLTISGAQLDPMYNSTRFSFKVLCPSDFDCVAAAPCCQLDDAPEPAVDYLAKDFDSFKLALSDFSSVRYPAWKERAEADVGIMLMEALCAVADELSYLQDRVAAEAAFPTATQRRSLQSLARLVDYEPQPARSATTTLQCDVVTGPVPAGLSIAAVGPDGTLVPFEIGTGLADQSGYVVSPAWNDGIAPYWFDDDQRFLPRGVTSMWLHGHGFGFDAVPNLPLLIQTDLPGETIRQVVHLASSVELFDPIFLENGAPTPVTRIDWIAADALLRDHDLTATRLAGNLLPATQGQRCRDTFFIGDDVTLSSAIARRGPNGTGALPRWIFRWPLSRGRLAWLMPARSLATDPDQELPRPEIVLAQLHPGPQSWDFARSLLDATAQEAAFTVDPIAWRAVAADDLGRPTQWDVDGDDGDTLRFGDGVFGRQPEEGAMFEARYRVGLGAAGNVAADVITVIDPAWSGYLKRARNPFVVADGADAETPQHIRRMAPQAFRARQYRAVRPEDYEAAADSLPWVQKAGTAFRWTGSWLTIFTAVDTKANEVPAPPQQLELVDLLNRRRLAGYESYVPQPKMVAIDLRIRVCAVAGWLRGDVEAGVLARLGSAQRCDGASGFFFADRFTFGTPLYKSRLEAAIQGVAGVAGVVDVQVRRRGATTVFAPLPEIFPLGSDEILRLDNDPDYPARGTLRVLVEGGR